MKKQTSRGAESTSERKRKITYVFLGQGAAEYLQMNDAAHMFSAPVFYGIRNLPSIATTIQDCVVCVQSTDDVRKIIDACIVYSGAYVVVISDRVVKDAVLRPVDADVVKRCDFHVVESWGHSRQYLRVLSQW